MKKTVIIMLTLPVVLVTSAVDPGAVSHTTGLAITAGAQAAALASVMHDMIGGGPAVTGAESATCRDVSGGWPA